MYHYLIVNVVRYVFFDTLLTVCIIFVVLFVVLFFFFKQKSAYEMRISDLSSDVCSSDLVNNVLCFPYIFRGALDVGATAINEEMKLACLKAIADLAMKEQSEVVAKAMGGEGRSFGPEYLIPSPFDLRLVLEIAPAVAGAAMDSGVATRPIEDFEAYRQNLQRFVFRSGLIMKPLFQRAKEDPKRVIYAEGEDERVLRAVQVVVDEGLAQPILFGQIGRAHV